MILMVKTEFDDGDGDLIVQLQAEVARLTAKHDYLIHRIGELTEKCHMWRNQNVRLEARENKLRAITGEMSPHPRVWDDAWSNCCAEWDRRAGGIV